MNNCNDSFIPFNTAGKAEVNKSRRAFLKQSSIAAATTGLASLGIAGSRPAIATEQSGFSRLSTNSMGYNGHRQDPVSGLYHLGNGYRVYNPGLMRFHAADSMSPFGRGGVNSYAYALGDPINLRDPSGHFAFFSLLIGAIIGALVGAAVSAVAEGIRSAATGDEFDLKQVFIGAALGFISGGFGAAAIGAKTGVQVGLAVADAVVSGAADFGLSTATGTNIKDAGINAGIGAAIGLITFGVGLGAKRIGQGARKLAHRSIGVGQQVQKLAQRARRANSSSPYRITQESIANLENGAMGRSFVGLVDIESRKVALAPLASAEYLADFPGISAERHLGRGFVVMEPDLGAFTIGKKSIEPILHMEAGIASHKQLFGQLNLRGVSGFRHRTSRGFALTKFGLNEYLINFNSQSYNAVGTRLPEISVRRNLIETLSARYGIVDF
ncbi:RHS repeat-associated core domain-containing protein [Microbulbifer sp. TYP-18]|uniref:RHS repeat-associated core domain-containing protein n=1 Tax=Microbulbifer sp. TYP-18 TaxID=3230024 RepID=UPI0034C5E269